MFTTEVDFSGRMPVDGYGPGFFRVGGRIHEGPLALLPAGPRAWGGLHDMALFVATADSFDVLLIGTGGGIAPLPPAALEALEAAGIGAETMATGSACRSYNVLLAEERRVAAALIPV